MALSGCMSDTTSLERELENARAKIAELEQSTQAYNKQSEVEDEIMPGQQAIISDLLEHQELIPYDGALGGTPFFVEKEIRVVSKWYDNYSRGFVYAPVEDGHWNAELILFYTIDEAGNIVWQLIASDAWEQLGIYGISFDGSVNCDLNGDSELETVTFFTGSNQTDFDLGKIPSGWDLCAQTSIEGEAYQVWFNISGSVKSATPYTLNNGSQALIVVCYGNEGDELFQLSFDENELKLYALPSKAEGLSAK